MFPFHLYADDTQLYEACKPEDVPMLVARMSDCVHDVKLWMSTNRLKLNDNKTEIIVIGDVAKDSPAVKININGHTIASANKVKNLGVYIDNDMSMSSHVSDLCRKLFFQIRKIGNIRNYINEEVAKTLVTSLILSKLDYCNVLLAGTPKALIDRLQLVQNSAARLVVRSKKREHVTPVLINLHWLPVEQRILYKLCILCYKCLNEQAPSYLSQSLNVYTPGRSLRSSSDKYTLVVPRRN